VVSCFILGKKYQVVGGLFRGPVQAAARRDIYFAAYDRLYAGFLRGEVELDGAEHIAVVGYRQGVHLVVGSRLQQFVYPAGSVQKAVLRVQMKMDEFGMGHLCTGFIP